MTNIVQFHSLNATRSHPWEPWVEPEHEFKNGQCIHCLASLVGRMNNPVPCRTPEFVYCANHPGMHSKSLDCINPKEMPLKEPAQARYWGITVEVVQQFEHYSLIRRPDSLSCVVETRDLTLLEVQK